MFSLASVAPRRVLLEVIRVVDELAGVPHGLRPIAGHVCQIDAVRQRCETETMAELADQLGHLSLDADDLSLSFQVGQVGLGRRGQATARHYLGVDVELAAVSVEE